ncbi:MAG: DUF1013 domain-containing protein [Rhodobacteraceae bacterium]|nr:DUF1013 domain-containing protein [Paracoccaceae bacterium]
MVLPMMPKATAVWLVENTTLTFEQIADFTGMHELEIQAIADGEVAIGIVGVNPVANGQLTDEEVKRCEADADARLKASKSDIPIPQARSKGARYTPVSKRQDRPDAISWLLKHHPELNDAQIARLIGTTKSTINSVRERTHWNTANIKPQNPVTLGLCTEADLEKAVVIAQRRRDNAIKAEERRKRREAREAAAAAAAAEVTQPQDATAPADTAATDSPATEAPSSETASGDAANAPAQPETPAETAGPESEPESAATPAADDDRQTGNA